MSMKAAGGSVSGRIMPMLGQFFSALSVAIAVGASLTSSAESVLAQQKPKLRPLHIALANHSVSMTSIYVAKHLGIFEGYGYDARILVLNRGLPSAPCFREISIATPRSARQRGQHCAARRFGLAWCRSTDPILFWSPAKRSTASINCAVK